MNRTVLIVAGILIIAAGLLINSAAFIVHQTEQAIVLRDRLLPDSHADLAAAYNNLAVARFTLKKFPGAAEAFKAAANCTALLHGRGHAGVALLRLNEARSLMSAGLPSTASQVITVFSWAHVRS